MSEIKPGSVVCYIYRDYICLAEVARVEGQTVFCSRARCVSGPHDRKWTIYNQPAQMGTKLKDMLPDSQRDVMWARLVAMKLRGEIVE